MCSRSDDSMGDPCCVWGNMEVRNTCTWYHSPSSASSLLLLPSKVNFF